MKKEGFNWKSIFIAEEDEGEKNSEQTIVSNNDLKSTSASQLPSANANSSLSESPLQSFDDRQNSTKNPFLGEILDVYEKGFESLNHEGFDFFELYKSVTVVGPNNPQSYQMAFAMGKSLKPDLSKEFLLEKSQVYIAEIEKVFKNYDVIGNSKQSELNKELASKKDNLAKEIENIKFKIEELTKDLADKTMVLQKIDSEKHQQFLEIQQKIEANGLAKQKILDSINTVIKGINQYL